jgi:hypothetical protein
MMDVKSLLIFGGAILLATTAFRSEAQSTCAAPGRTLTFSEPVYVDIFRAGGEPSVVSTPDGVLLYGAHAGTTHFFTLAGADEDSAAFAENYRGQVYAWFSEDDGDSWNFVDRTLPPDGVAGSGFSDPDFAIDAAGNVYLSEINLANVAVSKSTTSGRSYELQNFFGMVMSDRQWKTAGPENVLFIVGNVTGTGGTFPTEPVGNSGHTIFRSVDGGRTFSVGIADSGGLGDIKFDDTTGTLFEANLSGATLRISAFRNALAEDVETALTPEKHVIAQGVSLLSHWPAIDVDAAGNIYIVWDESGGGGRAAGIWYSASTDGGRTWLAPVRADPDDRTDIWPWIAVGEPGRVALAWFGNDNPLPNHNAESAGDDDPWNVFVAQTLDGLGCDESPIPGFQVARVTPEPFHVGTVCQGGTICQAELVDRRLGDYFTIDIDTNDGAVVAAYSDTRMGGAVALPAFFRQTGGAGFFRGPPLGVPPRKDVTGNITLHPSNGRFAGGAASFDLQLENASAETIAAPLSAEVVEINSPSGNVTAANADNAQTATGAAWSYDDSLNGDSELAVVELSATRTLQFNNAVGEPFSVTFAVFSGGESAATQAGDTTDGDGNVMDDTVQAIRIQLTLIPDPLLGTLAIDAALIE